PGAGAGAAARRRRGRRGPVTAPGKGAARALLRPLNRRLRHHVEEVTLPRLDDLSGQIDAVRVATVDVRRIVTDDLDASNEVAALLGRAIAGLTDSVEDLRREVAELRRRLDGDGPGPEA
ncbi:MAG TPA: hypothetical protein VFO65_06890, partial [Acidimicrobiales bacterium]|nr:hypothetical protein [Acidimicrobiales bacterium]